MASLKTTDTPWRIGRKVGRTIYAQVGEEASDEDRLIGMMDTVDLAFVAVACHNAILNANLLMEAVDDKHQGE